MVPFRAAFEALTDHKPFLWQERLYEKWFALGKNPRLCDLPTGLGKTAVIPMWLIALAHSREDGQTTATFPRRLVYIVNRRTVVDQATDEAIKLRKRLAEPPPEHKEVLADLQRKLAALSAGDDGNPLALSTLRGELADNGEWKANPAKPAIVIGTVDMIGSKLLFQGYGDGRYWRPHHAGILGQDTLIVHDEAHLTPAFGRLIRHIECVQKADKCSRPVRVMELSATTPADGEADEPPFGLEREDEDDRPVHQRIHARKRLKLHDPVADRKAVVKRLIELARDRREQNCRVLVYVTSPSEAREIHDTLRKDGVPDDHLALLTGTLRGYERDDLVNKPLFRWFRGGDPLPGTAYLVSTSAGEVGVDLDADHMVCDLSTLESIIQRLGRVNRKPDLLPDPEEKIAQVDVVAAKAVCDAAGKPARGENEALFKARQATWQALSQLPSWDDGRRDASPLALREIAGKTEAWSPPLAIPPLTDVLLDAWALTSVSGSLPARPPVGDWLHGISEGEPAETHVAWRAELYTLAEAGVQDWELAEALDVFPIRSAERMRDRTDRVLDELAKVARRHPHVKAVLIRDEAKWVPLAELAPADKKQRDRAYARLANATVLLPTEVGGLKDGYLNGDETGPASDVAEATVQGQRARQRVWINADGTEEVVCGGEVQQGFVTRSRISLRDDEFAGEEGQRQRIALAYRIGSADPGERLGAGESKESLFLKVHVPAVADRTVLIASCLGLEKDEKHKHLAEALKLAAQWHDNGKARDLWQRAAGNPGDAEPLAKSGKRGLNWRALQGYRHEFGSLLEAARDPTIQQHPERDLILHLIAAHHGWARPHFDLDAGDAEKASTRENREAIEEAMRRYARLQQRFGRWGLAWLEALLRCADGLASAAPSATAPETQP